VGRQVYYSLATPEIESIVSSVFNTEAERDPELRLEELAKKYAKAAVAGDESQCGDILETVFRAKVSTLDIYEELIAPAMRLIGRWYEVDAVDEAQEHLASNITERMMSRASALTSASCRHDGIAIVGCGPGSFHTIGLRMVSDMLRIHGWKTLFLGANTPITGFINAVENHRPTLVLVGGTSEGTLVDTLSLVEKLAACRSRTHSFQIGAGGQGVSQDPAAFLKAGADFCTASLKEFTEVHLPRLARLPVEA
jgi:methanogenic corrinoid protein MtbC1